MNLDKIDITKLNHDEKAQLYDQLMNLKVKIESESLIEGYTIIPRRAKVKRESIRTTRPFSLVHKQKDRNY